jgi:flagellar protein FliS
MSARFDLTYQRVAVENASPRNLTILLYDRLVADIQSAIAAMIKGDIEKRCNVINHGFLILQQLQCGLNMEDGGETAESLDVFYRHIHSTLILAQTRNSADMLQEVIERILQVRSAWYEVESRETANAQGSVAGFDENQGSPVMRRSIYDTDELPVSSWSA